MLDEIEKIIGVVLVSAVVGAVLIIWRYESLKPSIVPAIKEEATTVVEPIEPATPCHDGVDPDKFPCH